MGTPHASIFVVDDQKALVDSIESILKYRGFDVFVATDPKRALDLSEQIRPDLLLTDIRMRRLNGIELIKKIKAKQPRVKVIIMTGYYPEYEKDIQELKKTGMLDADLKKPFDFRKLEDLVFEVLQFQKRAEEKPPKGRLLVVDDEEQMLVFFTEHFMEQGYQITVTSVPEEALELVRSFSPDVVITDINMPGMDGITLIKEIRKINGKIHFVVLTGQVDRPTVDRLAKETGITEYLRKPVGFPEIESLIGKLSNMMVDSKDSSSKLSEDRKK